MRTSEVFDSKWLKAADLGGSRAIVTIERYEVQKMTDGKRKAVLFFKGKEKGLVLNATNANSITGMTGTDEMDEWIGHRICLYSTKVDFQGRRVDAIRVEDAPISKHNPPKPAPKAQPAEDFNPAEDDVPF